jgi:hypothetical protein
LISESGEIEKEVLFGISAVSPRLAWKMINELQDKNVFNSQLLLI